MKAIVVASQGAPFVLSSDLPRPSPGAGEILVQTLAVAINPVDWKQAEYGFLIDEFPAVLGTDTAGEVVEVGANVTNLKIGDKVFGCTRLGMNKYTAFNEFHLMDAELAIPYSKNMTDIEAASAGVAALTAGLGVFASVKLLNPSKVIPIDDEKGWALVCGGASAVGMWAIQYYRLAGYKVIVTCSPKNVQLVTSYGAHSTVNYRETQEAQLQFIKAATNGSLSHVFDAVGPETAKVGVTALEQSIFKGPKAVAGVDLESVTSSDSSIAINAVLLGLLGRDPAVNATLVPLVTMIHGLCEAEQIKHLPIKLIGGEHGGWESIIEGVVESKKGVSGEKLVVVI